MSKWGDVLHIGAVDWEIYVGRKYGIFLLIARHKSVSYQFIEEQVINFINQRFSEFAQFILLDVEDDSAHLLYPERGKVIMPNEEFYWFVFDQKSSCILPDKSIEELILLNPLLKP